MKVFVSMILALELPGAHLIGNLVHFSKRLNFKNTHTKKVTLSLVRYLERSTTGSSDSFEFRPASARASVGWAVERKVQQINSRCCRL
jgi:hypothetical protein